MAFDSEEINRFYNLPPMDNEGYQKLWDKPNYAEINKCLTDGQA